MSRHLYFSRENHMYGGVEMVDKNSSEENTKQLTLVVVFLSVFVAILFGVVPMI